MGTICFVILNYKTWREAAACAESILKTQQGQDIRIVLVDNGSGNGSEESLREEFAGEKRVHVIASEKNLGFARGNNLGIRYARSHFEPDFIVAANSDIIFEQEDYCEKLREIYKEERFDILGGDIVDASRTRHFNPVARNRQYTLNYMRKQILVSWAKCKMFQLIKLFHLKKAIAGHYGVVSDETGRDVKDGSKNLTTREEDGKSVSADSRVDERIVAWLNQIAVNKCKDFLMKKIPEPVEENSIDTELLEENDNFLPESYVLNAEKRKIILTIMQEELSAVQYQTIILYYFDGMSVPEIAACMECPEGTVKYRLSTARGKIRNGVQDYEDTSGIKLYSSGSVALLTAIFIAESQSLNIPNVISNIFAGAAGIAGTAAGAKAAGIAGTAAGAKAAGVAGTAAGAKAAGVAGKAGM
jgi:RNA polymerase sigma factor (sigma-70 family)